MRIKANLFFVMVQLLFLQTNHAACNLEQIRFGSSPEFVREQFPETPLMFDTHDLPRSIQMVPGEIVCQGENEFLGVPIQYVFLYGELVEINVFRLSEDPSLLSWVETVYGEKVDKPHNLYSAEPNGQLLWDTPNSVIVYSFTAQGTDRTEVIRIQSRRHERHYARYAREEEEAIETGIWPGNQPSRR